MDPHWATVNKWLENSDQMWTQEIGSFYDPLDPALIHDALADTTHGFKSVVFGWGTIGRDGPSDDAITELFVEGNSEFNS